MRLFIKYEDEEAHQAFLVISCSGANYEVVISVVQQFLYDYVSFLKQVRENSNERFSRIYLFLNGSNGLEFVIRRGKLFFVQLKQEELIGCIDKVVEDSIEHLKQSLTDFPWKSFGFDEREEREYLDRLSF